jgi:TorA maturation chaperone TorD
MSITSETSDSRPQAARAQLSNAWLVLAEAYAPPPAWSDEIDTHVASVFGPLGGPAAACAQELVTRLRAARKDQQPAEVTHTRLFIGPYEIRAPAYASLYLDPDRRLMGATSQHAASFYAEAGLGPGDGPREAPDHLLHELEFMYFLGFQEVDTGERKWAELRRRFWSEHLSQWLPQMVALMHTVRPNHPVYAALAELTEEVIRLESAAHEAEPRN